MMRSRVAIGVAAAVLLGATALHAEELKSGLQVGKGLPAYQVVKCGGAPNDNVKVGQQLCYRWKLGGRSVVTAFINADKVKTDDLASLVKEIDKTIDENKGLFSFVNLIGEDRDDLEAKAKKLGEGVKNVAICVPVEFELGPKNYGVNPEVAVTVMAYTGLKVKTNIATNTLDKKTVEAVVTAAKELVN